MHLTSADILNSISIFVVKSGVGAWFELKNVLLITHVQCFGPESADWAYRLLPLAENFHLN
jgi:hypothetical protein